MTIKKPESNREDTPGGGSFIVEPGDYIYQFTGGIEIKKSSNEDSGWKAINFPVQVVQVKTGDGAIDDKGSFTFTVLNDTDKPNEFIDETMGWILDYTDLLEKFISKYGEDIDYTDQGFIDDLNVKLTGKLIGIIHWNEKKGDYVNMRVGTRYKYGADDQPVTKDAKSNDSDW